MMIFLESFRKYKGERVDDQCNKELLKLKNKNRPRKKLPICVSVYLLHATHGVPSSMNGVGA